LAYIALDGTPRVVPIGYLWKDGRVIVCTVPTSAKVKALRQNPAVPLTIDYDGQPTRALLLRGRASIKIVKGVPRSTSTPASRPKVHEVPRLRGWCPSDV